MRKVKIKSFDMRKVAMEIFGISELRWVRMETINMRDRWKPLT